MDELEELEGRERIRLWDFWTERGKVYKYFWFSFFNKSVNNM